MTDAPTLAAWLLERIAEDEAAARAASPGPWRTFPDAEGGVWAREGYGMAATGCGEGNAEHIARHDPARVLAECAAKRQIVERLTDLAAGGPLDEYTGYDATLVDVLRAYAAPYADRQGFREEWR